MKIELFNPGFWIRTPKHWLREYGPEIAYVLSYMMAIEQKDENGWFELTRDHMKDEMGLTRSMQDRILNKLKELGLIETETRGVPGKRFVCVIEEKLAL